MFFFYAKCKYSQGGVLNNGLLQTDSEKNIINGMARAVFKIKGGGAGNKKM